MIEVATQRGFDTTCLIDRYAIYPTKSPLASHQAEIEVTVGEKGGVRCPFGCQPVAIASGLESPLIVERCISGDLFVEATPGTVLKLIYEKSAWSKDLHAASEMLSRIIPSLAVEVPEYLKDIEGFLGANLPLEIKGNMLLQQIKQSMIYTLDPHLGEHLSTIGSNALAWATEAGIGWCHSKAAFVANLLNSIGIPAWILTGSACNISESQYVEQPGHAIVALVLDGKLLRFDPTIGATDRTKLNWQESREDIPDIISHARNVRKDTLASGEQASNSPESRPSHECRDDFSNISEQFYETLSRRIKAERDFSEGTKTNNLYKINESLGTLIYLNNKDYNLAYALKETGHQSPDLKKYLLKAANVIAKLDPKALDPHELVEALALYIRLSAFADLNMLERVPQLRDAIKSVPPANVLSWDLSISLRPALCSGIYETKGSIKDHNSSCDASFDLIEKYLEAQGSNLSKEHWKDLQDLLLSAAERLLLNVSSPVARLSSTGFDADDIPLSAYDQAVQQDPSKVITEFHAFLQAFERLFNKYPGSRPNDEDVLRSAFSSTNWELNSRMFEIFGKAAEGTDFANVITANGQLGVNGKLAAQLVFDLANESTRSGISASRDILMLRLLINSDQFSPDPDKVKMNALDLCMQAEQRIGTANLRSAIAVTAVFYSDEALIPRFQYGELSTRERAELLRDCGAEVSAIMKNSPSLLAYVRSQDQSKLFDILLNRKNEEGRSVVPLLASSPLASSLYGCALVESFSLLPALKDTELAWISSFLNRGNLNVSISAEQRLEQREMYKQMTSISPLFRERAAEVLSDPEYRVHLTNITKHILGFGIDNRHAQLAHWLQTAPEAHSFRAIFGSSIEQQRKKLFEICSLHGPDSGLEALSEAAKKVPFNSADIFVALCYVEKPLAPGGNANKVIPLKQLISETLSGKLNVPTLNPNKKKAKELGVSRRHSVQGSYDPYENRLEVVRPGQRVMGRIDWQATAKSDDLIVRVPIPVNSRRQDLTPKTFVVHAEWLTEAVRNNHIGYPERLLSLVKELEKARRSGHPARVMYWDGIRISSFAARNPSEIIACAESLLKAAYFYSKQAALMALAEPILMDNVPNFGRNEEVLFLAGKSAKAKEHFARLAKKINVMPSNITTI